MESFKLVFLLLIALAVELCMLSQVAVLAEQWFWVLQVLLGISFVLAAVLIYISAVDEGHVYLLTSYD
ncbi:MAG: hypothetical protein HRU20_11760 [Pseudomonadales bacterium]|nr:hypothetical protein [Pseudomonadales bacterium]